MFLEETCKETELQKGDLIGWRLRDGNLGITRNGIRLLFCNGDDRHGVIDQADHIRITESTSFLISDLIASIVGCRIKRLRADKEVVVYQLF